MVYGVWCMVYEKGEKQVSCVTFVAHDSHVQITPPTSLGPSTLNCAPDANFAPVSVAPPMDLLLQPVSVAPPMDFPLKCSLSIDSHDSGSPSQKALPCSNVPGLGSALQTPDLGFPSRKGPNSPLNVKPGLGTALQTPDLVPSSQKEPLGSPRLVLTFQTSPLNSPNLVRTFVSPEGALNPQPTLLASHNSPAADLLVQEEGPVLPQRSTSTQAAEEIDPPNFPRVESSTADSVRGYRRKVPSAPQYPHSRHPQETEATGQLGILSGTSMAQRAQFKLSRFRSRKKSYSGMGLTCTLCSHSHHSVSFCPSAPTDGYPSWRLSSAPPGSRDAILSRCHGWHTARNSVSSRPQRTSPFPTTRPRVTTAPLSPSR